MSKPTISLIATLFILSLLGMPVAPGDASLPQAEGDQYVFLPLILKIDPPEWLGPYGGKIVSFAISDQFPQVMYAGTWGAGVFKSVNGGASWKPVNKGLGNQDINALAVDPQNPDVVYAGTYGDKVFKTTSGGENWYPVGTGIQAEAKVYAIAIDPLNTDRLYVATRGISKTLQDGTTLWRGVVYRSSNGGATWKPELTDVGTTQDWAYSLAVHPTSPNIIFAAMHENGVMRSSDYGDNWSLKENGITDSTGRVVLIDPVTPSTIYYGTWHNNVFKSLDTGKTWTNLDVPKIKVIDMTVNKQAHQTVYLASWEHYGVKKTVNGGETWQSKGLSFDDLYTVDVDPLNASIVYVGTYANGLYWSTNGGEAWSHRQTGIANTSVESLLVQPDVIKTVYISVYGGGVSRLVSPQNWESYNQGLPGLGINGLARDPSNNNILFALTDSSGLYRRDVSLAGGWVRVDQGLPSGLALQVPRYMPDHPFASLEDLEAEAIVPLEPGLEEPFAPLAVNPSPLLAMEFAPSAANIAYMGVNSSGTSNPGLYYSADGGIHWSPRGLASKKVWRIAVSPVLPGELYAAAESVSGVYHSLNAGQDWESFSLPVSAVYDLVIPAGDPLSVYAGTNSGVYKLTNSSGAFQQSGLSGIEVTVLAAHPQDPGAILAGTDQGVYVTYDGGAAWSSVVPELAGLTIKSISFDPLDPHNVYFGTKSHGALKAYLFW